MLSSVLHLVWFLGVQARTGQNIRVLYWVCVHVLNIMCAN